VRETPEDVRRLQALLDESDARGGSHLRSIITDERRLSAEQLIERLQGMSLLTLATATRDGAPIAGPVDGIFYRGEFWFGSAPNALKFQHIRERPRVSATHLPGEHLGVTVHGTAHIEGIPAELPDEVQEVCVEIYGQEWFNWGDDALYARIEPRRMFVFHMEPPEAGGQQDLQPEA
jgi:general stress protein 26